jgi:hypothetical protein
MTRWEGLRDSLGTCTLLRWMVVGVLLLSFVCVLICKLVAEVHTLRMRSGTRWLEADLAWENVYRVNLVNLDVVVCGCGRWTSCEVTLCINHYFWKLILGLVKHSLTAIFDILKTLPRRMIGIFRPYRWYWGLWGAVHHHVKLLNFCWSPAWVVRLLRKFILV